ncbi:MAG: hypothetical protein ABFC56_13640 [Clostridiaceae bacterium]
MAEGFEISAFRGVGSGFRITFENGYTVSIQFGSNSYCANYHKKLDTTITGNVRCDNAEVAVVHPCGEFVGFPETGDIIGINYTPAQVLNLLNWAASQKA